MIRRRCLPEFLLGLCLTLSSCGGGGPSGGCSGNCQQDIPQRLEIAEVQTVIAQAVAEAQAQKVGAVIAVTDRVGNVLAVFKMSNARNSVTVDSQRDTGTGLDGLGVVPSPLAAIAKAITGAYLSSEGNAFSTRTASQIVQEHFNPGELGQPGGPLFGVQFSSLPCSDFNTRYSGGAIADIGPKRSPLGLSADPGGFPLYKNGTVVGGVGIISDGFYSLDLDITDRDRSVDELIAIAATAGFDAPADRRADRITVGGKTLRYTDVETADTLTGGRNTLSFSAAGASGALEAVGGYSAATILAGTDFGTAQSGYAAATEGAFSGLDAFRLVNADGTPRYPPRAGSDGLLSATEVTELLKDGIAVANRTRAQIRRPLGSQMRGSFVVVDTKGAILGVLRTRDAPVFGTDVALQKARTAMFLSSPGAAAALQAAGSVTYIKPQGSPGDATIQFADYSRAMTALIGVNALDGTYAYGARSIGNFERPFFPDGIDGYPNGPLSKPYAQWSPFSTGLQLDLVYERIAQHVLFGLGAGPDVGPSCAGPPGPVAGFNTTVPAALGDGLQIFAGGVPIYRGSQLIGAVGVSGDGIDQDDMVAFLGVYNAGQTLGTLGNAPIARRIDQLNIQGQKVRYVECPQAPFLDSNEQAPCDGK
ncbi:heme-binding protein, partial [Nevskia soli]|uniref:heme-binding protein n=1 Tax=Nevskia soli TaxID=418856 RepID=UPI0004A70D7F